MKPLLGLFLTACLYAQTTTYRGYNWTTGAYDLPQSIVYRVPAGPGPFPVFIWVPGTFQLHFDVMSLVIVNEMANRGFLAASVQYDNFSPIQFCPVYEQRARSVFDATRADSAIGVMCGLPGADCSKGIATAGISQGGVLAVLAKNYAPRVTATWAMSVSAHNKLFGLDLPCLDKANTAISAERLRIVNGESDPVFGGQVAVERAAGFTCAPGSFECSSPIGNGAGWYIVRDAEVDDRVAGHCYQMIGDCTGFFFDSTWFFSTTAPWGLRANLDWLSWTTRLHLSAFRDRN